MEVLNKMLSFTTLENLTTLFDNHKVDDQLINNY